MYIESFEKVEPRLKSQGWTFSHFPVCSSNEQIWKNQKYPGMYICQDNFGGGFIRSGIEKSLSEIIQAAYQRGLNDGWAEAVADDFTHPPEVLGLPDSPWDL